MLPSGEGLKKWNFVYVLFNSAPVLYGTNRSIPLLHFAFFNFHFSICIRLSSGKNSKMRNFGGVLRNFAPVLCGTNRSRGLEKTAASRHRDPSADGSFCTFHFAFCILLRKALPVRVGGRMWALRGSLRDFMHRRPSLAVPAHGEAVPAGKLNTTQTMLPSGEGLKKRNFVYVLFNSAPVLYGTNRSILLLYFALFNLHFAIFPAGPCFPFCSRGFPLFSLHSLLSGHLNLRLWLRSGYKRERRSSLGL